MKNNRSHWLVLTPVYKPASAGGAVYTDLLARSLAKNGHDVNVYTEKFPGQPNSEKISYADSSLRIRRIFPLRASRPKKDGLFYVNFAMENILYIILSIFFIIRTRKNRNKEYKILIHCSYLYKPSIFLFLLLIINSFKTDNVKIILDVRDNYFNYKYKKFIKYFDCITCSSESNTLLMIGFSDNTPVHYIPMPFEHVSYPDEEFSYSTLERHGLIGKKYLLNSNGITYRKYYPQMRKAIPILRESKGFEDIILVTVGRERDRRLDDNLAESRGETLYLGIISHQELYVLMKAALFTLVLSDEEAISRSALEAMSVGGRVILPNIAEFRAECRSHILEEIDPAVLAGKVIALSGNDMPRFDYDRHDLRTYLHLYENL